MMDGPFHSQHIHINHLCMNWKTLLVLLYNMTRPLNPYAPEYNPTSHAPPPSFRQTIYHPHYLIYTPLTYFSPQPPRPAKLTPRRKRVSKLEKRGESRPKIHLGFSSPATIRNRHKTVPIVQEDEKTTVMIKNIPYDCPRKRLIRILDSFCSEKNEEGGFRCSYDFLYLPIDFSTRRGRGFAFVNFTSSVAVWKFFEAFHNKQWEEWCKKLEIVSAKIQGKEALVRHFSQSMFECETDEYLPVMFTPARDGGGQSSDVTAIGNRRPHHHRHRHPTNN